MLSPNYLVAIIAALGCSISESVIVAGSHTIMQAGKSAGLYVAAVPPSLAARAGTPPDDVSFV